MYTTMYNNNFRTKSVNNIQPRADMFKKII